jgi:hypothetical protein
MAKSIASRTLNLLNVAFSSSGGCGTWMQVMISDPSRTGTDAVALLYAKFEECICRFVGPLVEFLKREGPVFENKGLPIRCYQGTLRQYLANDHRTILLKLKKSGHATRAMKAFKEYSLARPSPSS